MMTSAAMPTSGVKSFCLLDHPFEGVAELNFLGMGEPFLASSSCDDTADPHWMCTLWDAPEADVTSALDATASSIWDGTTFEFDCSSVDASEEQSVNDATSPASNNAASADKAVPSSCWSDVVTSEAGLPLSLRLDYNDVLEAWKQRGGAVQDTCTAAGPAPVSLQLPVCGAHDAALLAAFGSYAGSDSGSAPTSPMAPGSRGGMPMFVPLHDLSVDRITSAQDASGSDATPMSLMPLIPSSSSGLCWGAPELGTTPQSLSSIASKTADARTARAACALRCKQKKSSRQVVKVRYEMRKLNAEQRPRFKGRFVKRELGSDSMDSETLASASSLASELSDMDWLLCPVGSDD